MTDGLERRDLVRGGALLAGTAVAATLSERTALAQTTSNTGAQPMTYDIKPMSFDPKAIKACQRRSWSATTRTTTAAR